MSKVKAQFREMVAYLMDTKDDKVIDNYTETFYEIHEQANQKRINELLAHNHNLEQSNTSLMDKLKERKKDAHNIEWKAQASDDFIAYVGNYCLRAEQMRKKQWWFAVYHKDSEIFIDIQSAFSKEHAKHLAELEYKAHYLEKSITP